MNMPPQDMLKAAKNTIQHAYAPYSKFSVAACVRTKDNTLFTGCNVENASFPLTICAEVNAIGAMIASGHRLITEALILTPTKKVCPPCGACRQCLLEFSALDLPIHLITVDGNYQCYKLAELLPHSFGPNDLEA